jgi:hypothetical protein
MIQQTWPPSQRLVRAMVLRCWVRQLPHGADLIPALIASVPPVATLEAEQVLGHSGA